MRLKNRNEKVTKKLMYHQNCKVKRTFEEKLQEYIRTEGTQTKEDTSSDNKRYTLRFINLSKKTSFCKLCLTISKEQ